METNHRRVQRSYPLSALFVLLAGCAVVSALLAPVARAVVVRQATIGQTVVASICGLLLVGVLGAVIGLYHYRPLRGVGWGILTGSLIGMLVGPVMLAPPEAIGTLVTMSIGGSIMLLITGAAFGVRTGE